MRSLHEHLSDVRLHGIAQRVYLASEIPITSGGHVERSVVSLGDVELAERVAELGDVLVLAMVV